MRRKPATDDEFGLNLRLSQVPQTLAENGEAHYDRQWTDAPLTAK